MSTQDKKIIARWRKQPRATGQAGMGQARRGMQLREGDKVVISVSVSREFGGSEKGWYWYGLGMNSSNVLCATMEEAKAQADAYYKAYKKTLPASQE